MEMHFEGTVGCAHHCSHPHFPRTGPDCRERGMVWCGCAAGSLTSSWASRDLGGRAGLLGTDVVAMWLYDQHPGLGYLQLKNNND